MMRLGDPIQSGRCIIPALKDSQSMAFLGGLPPDGENKVDATSVYGSLAARNEDLLSKNTIKLKEDWTRTVFQTLWEGEFIVHWKVCEDNTGVPMFVFTSIVQDESIPIQHRGGIITHAILKDRSGGDGHTMSLRKSIGVENSEICNHSFLSLFSENKTDRLGKRIAHRIYRAVGAQLPPDFHPFLFRFCKLACTNNAYSDLLDVAIASADISINTQQSSIEIEKKLIGVVQCLETLGRFADSASLCEEIALNPSTENPADFWGLAGMDRMRNCEYIAAERVYLKALNYSCLERLDFSDKCTRVMFSQLLHIYYTKTDQFHTTFTERSHGRAKTAFVALLFAAGFDVRDKRVLQSVVDIEGRELQRYLKAGLKSAAKAKRALLKAVRSADTNEYRTALMSCLDPNKEIAPRNWYEFEATEQLYLQMARQVFEHSSHDRQWEFELFCGNPGCQQRVVDDEHCTLRQCPCKTVNYCSTECQVADWPVHKHHCSKHGSKKKKKGGKKKSGGADTADAKGS